MTGIDMLRPVNRIDQRFQNLREQNRKGFVAYIGAGDPDLESTEAIALCLADSGVDVLELGVPFSDPLADGLVNQLAAQRGLASGTTPEGLLETVAAIRKQSDVPIVLYIYFHLMHRTGRKEFIQSAAAAGVDGLLALDLPPEEADEYEQLMKEASLCSIWLIAPTTPEERIAAIAARGSGFIYYISREGVTGMRQDIVSSLDERIAAIRRHTNLPIAVGFGISNADQVRQVAADCDAVVVGSAIVNQIAEHGKAPDLPERVGGFVRELIRHWLCH